MERLTKISQKVKEMGWDALLIGRPENLFYTTSFGGEDSWLIVLADGTSALLTDGRFWEEAQNISNCVPYCQKPGHGLLALVQDICQEREITKLAFESDFFTFQIYAALCDKLEGTKLIPCQGLIENFREIKDAKELALLRQVAAIGDTAFANTLPHIRPGITEKELAEILRQQLVAAGADDLSFPTIAASGPNCSICHAKPGERLLQAGDLVLMDFGGKYKGYCGDMTRTVQLGPVDLKAEVLYNVVLAAQQAAFDAIRPGEPLEAPHLAAVRVFQEAGLAEHFVHSIGHGVGLEIHEGPRVSRGSQAEMRPGQVISVEPGLYLPGWGGIRIEDVVIITEQGFENITHSCKDFLILS